MYFVRVGWEITRRVDQEGNPDLTAHTIQITLNSHYVPRPLFGGSEDLEDGLMKALEGLSMEE